MASYHEEHVLTNDGRQKNEDKELDYDLEGEKQLDKAAIALAEGELFRERCQP